MLENSTSQSYVYPFPTNIVFFFGTELFALIFVCKIHLTQTSLVLYITDSSSIISYIHFWSIFCFLISCRFKYNNIAPLINFREWPSFLYMLIIYQFIIIKNWIIVQNLRYLILILFLIFEELNISIYHNLSQMRLKDHVCFILKAIDNEDSQHCYLTYSINPWNLTLVTEQKHRYQNSLRFLILGLKPLHALNGVFPLTEQESSCACCFCQKYFL